MSILLDFFQINRVFGEGAIIVPAGSLGLVIRPCKLIVCRAFLMPDNF
jgi:hypothetical protein